MTSVEYLGNIVSKGGVSTDPGKVEARKSWLRPSILKELRGFLGLKGYYRKFVKRYGIISKPLKEQLKKGGWNWGQEEDMAFEQLKSAMTHAPVLALPYFSKTFLLEKDACDVGIGAVLMQDGRPLSYLSKALGIKNRGLSTYEKSSDSKIICDLQIPIVRRP